MHKRKNGSFGAENLLRQIHIGYAILKFFFEKFIKGGIVLSKILKSITKRIVYNFTKKPTQYVHVDKPKSLQDLRQIQYNNWCKRYGVYNGSYLPKDPNRLTFKGWKETTNPNNQSRSRLFERKSSGQTIRYDDKALTIRGTVADEHYHWDNPNKDMTSGKTQNNTKYLDRYGNSCKKGSKQSHLAPFDRDYKFK